VARLFFDKRSSQSHKPHKGYDGRRAATRQHIETSGTYFGRE